MNVRVAEYFLCIQFHFLNHTQILRYVRIIEGVWCHYDISLYSNLRSSPYCCVCSVLTVVVKPQYNRKSSNRIEPCYVEVRRNHLKECKVTMVLSCTENYALLRIVLPRSLESSGSEPVNCMVLLTFSIFFFSFLIGIVTGVKYLEDLAHLDVVKRLFQLRNEIGGLPNNNYNGEKETSGVLPVPDYRTKLFKLRENLESLSPEVVQSLLSENEYAYIKSFLQSERAFQNHLDISDQLIGSDTQSIGKKASDEIAGDRRSSGTKTKDDIMNFFKNRTELVEELQEAVEDTNLDGDVTSNFFPWKLKDKYDNQQFAHYKHHTSKENPFKYQPITKLHTPVGNDNFFDFNHLAASLHNLDKVKEFDLASAKAGNLSLYGDNIHLTNSNSSANNNSTVSGNAFTANTRSALIQNVLPEFFSPQNETNSTEPHELTHSSLVEETTGNSRVIDPVKKKKKTVFAKFAPEDDVDDTEHKARYVPMWDYMTGHVKDIPANNDYPQDKAMEEVTIKGPESGPNDGNQNNLTSSNSMKPLQGSGSAFKPLVPYSNKLEGYLKGHKVKPNIPVKAMPYIGEGQIFTPQLHGNEASFERVEEREDTTFEPNLSDQNILENLIKASPLIARKRQEIHAPPALHVLQFVDDVIHHDTTSVNKKRPPGIYTAKRAETVNGRKDFLNTNKPGENPFGPNGLHRDIIRNVLKQYKKEARQENEARRRAIMQLHKLAAYQDKMLAKHKKRRKRLPVVFNYNGRDEHINLRMHEWDDVDVWPHAHGHDFDHEFDHHDDSENLQVKRRKTNVARIKIPKSKMADVGASKKTTISERRNKVMRKHFEMNIVDIDQSDDVEKKDNSQRSDITPKINIPDFDPEIEDEESGSGDWDESVANQDERIVDFTKSGDEEELVDFPPLDDQNDKRSNSFKTEDETGNKKSSIETRASDVTATRSENFFENTQVSFDGTDKYVTLPSNLYFEKFDEDTVDELPNVGGHGIQGNGKSRDLELSSTKETTTTTKLSAENLIPSSDSFESIAPEQSALTPENVRTSQLPKQRSVEERRYFDVTSSLNNAYEEEEDENKDGGQSSGSVKHDVESVNNEEKNQKQVSVISADNIGDLGNQDETQNQVTEDNTAKQINDHLKATSSDKKTTKQMLLDDRIESDVTKYSNTEDAEQTGNEQGKIFLFLT